MSSGGIAARLYRGEADVDIVGRRKIWFMVAGIAIVIAIASMLVRGFTLGIEFEGGTRIQFPTPEGVTTEQVETVYSDALGMEPVSVQTGRASCRERV